jgi:hypothetical protein
MKDIELMSGRWVTDAECVEEHGHGDRVTSFLATKEDLKLLAHALADELLAYDFGLGLCSGGEPLKRRNYTSFRLDRVMEFLPELEKEIQEKLRRGYAENEVEQERVVSEWELEAKQRKQAEIDKTKCEDLDR